MGPHPRLTSEQRSIAIGMLHDGMQAYLLLHILVLQLAPYRDLKVVSMKLDVFRTDQGQGELRKRQLLMTVIILWRQGEIVSCQPLNLRNRFMLRQTFVFQHKQFGIAFINMAYVAGVYKKELFLRPTTLVRVYN